MGPEILSGEWIKVEDKQGKIMGLAMLPAGTAKELGSHNFVELLLGAKPFRYICRGQHAPQSSGQFPGL